MGRVWAGEGSPMTQMSPGWLPGQERDEGRGPEDKVRIRNQAACVSFFQSPVPWDVKGLCDSFAASEHWDPVEVWILWFLRSL